MADPHIKSPMDFFRLSDCYYLPHWFCDSGVGCSYSELVSRFITHIYINCGNLLCLFVTHLLKIFSIAFSICYLDRITFFILIIILRWLLAVRYLL